MPFKIVIRDARVGGTGNSAWSPAWYHACVVRDTQPRKSLLEFQFNPTKFDILHRKMLVSFDNDILISNKDTWLDMIPRLNVCQFQCFRLPVYGFHLPVYRQCMYM